MIRLRKNSIQGELLGWLLIPIGILWLVSTFAAYSFADRFANDAYDEIMLNSADSIIARVKLNGKTLVVDLPPAARDILEHDNQDEFYYDVLMADGRQLSADADLPLPGYAKSLPLWKPKFSDGTFKGKPVRIGVIRVPVKGDPNDIVVVIFAETLRARNHFANQITFSIVVPQLVFILLSALAVSVGISKALAPLKGLRESLQNRSKYDLTPIASKEAPVEVQPLVVAINDLMVELNQDLEAQRRFVGNAAHQLRTPLAGLKTYLALLKRKKQGESQDLLDQLDIGMDRLNKLVGSLLSLAKAEPSANRSAEFTTVNMNNIARDITKALQPEAEKKDILIDFQPNSEDALVQGDPVRLQDLVSNLVDNAIVYSSRGSHVRIQIREAPGTVELLVDDDGPGIPREERERVFERFYRVLGTGVDGSGLGLSIVKEIAIMHDAKVAVDTSELGGTRFIVSFKRSSAALVKSS